MKLSESSEWPDGMISLAAGAEGRRWQGSTWQRVRGGRGGTAALHQLPVVC